LFLIVIGIGIIIRDADVEMRRQDIFYPNGVYG
jgi:hypothetical protein